MLSIGRNRHHSLGVIFEPRLRMGEETLSAAPGAWARGALLGFGELFRGVFPLGRGGFIPGEGPALGGARRPF